MTQAFDWTYRNAAADRKDIGFTTLAFAERPRGRDLPGDPDKIGAAREFQRGVDRRHRTQHRAKPEPDADQQRKEPGADTDRVRDRPAKAELRQR